MNEISAALAGYSVISCLLLCVVYLASLPEMHKSRNSKLACVALMAALAAVQFAHLLYFVNGTPLLSFRGYALLLGTVPVAYLFFSREILFHNQSLSLIDLAHAGLLLLILILPLILAPTVAFLAGCAYTFYIYFKVLPLRRHVPRFRFEKFFFALFFAMTVVALVLGLSIPFLEPVFFYHAYAGCISVAMILVVGALLTFPDLLSDVLLASEIAYAKSKLVNINISDKRQQLEVLMNDSRCYENENLTLAQIAEQLDLSSQQLSELVNSNFEMSFPRYIRQHRVEAAKQMLLDEPNVSVLSISMATGFKSQSSFYSAFKELTGEAPVGFRKSNSQAKSAD